MVRIVTFDQFCGIHLLKLIKVVLEQKPLIVAIPL